MVMVWLWRAQRASGVKGEHAPFNMFSAHKIAVYIIKHFIRINVGVVVGRRDGQGMIIKKPWNEGANDEIMPIEGLMHRRWLVYTPGDGLKIMETKGVGIHISVPADHIKRVVEVMIWVNIVLLFDVKKEVAFLIKSLKLYGFSDVTFTKRGMFQQLPEFIAITFGCGDRSGTFHNK
jgi:hypothetical protein